MKLARLAAKLQAKRKRADAEDEASDDEMASNPRKRVLNRAVDAIATMLEEDASMSRTLPPRTDLLEALAGADRARYTVCSGSRYTDIDGLACAVGVAELLRSHGHQASAWLGAPWNDTIPHFVHEWREAMCTAPGPSAGDRFIIVDVSDPSYLPEGVAIESVAAVVDHHFGHKSFWESKHLSRQTHVQIEPVASCASLVAELFERSAREPSPLTARLLWLALLSNSLDLQLALTGNKDRKAEAFLCTRLGVADPAALRRELFDAVSAQACSPA